MWEFKCDLKVENFSRFFEQQMMQMTPAQKDRVPSGIMKKLFRSNGVLTTKKLNFIQQLYVLCQGFNEEVFIIIKRAESEIGILDFEKFQKNLKHRKVSQDEADHYLGKGVMVLSGKDLTQWVAHINEVSLSAPYNYALRLARTKDPELSKHDREFFYLASMLAKYEGNKRKIIRDRKITMPEWYVLLYLLDGRERGSTQVYEQVYSDALNGSRQQILNAFKKLVVLGYIEMFGKGKATVYKITALGKSEARGIMSKYLIP